MYSTQHLQIPQAQWTKQALLEQLSQEQILERLGLPVDETAGQPNYRFTSPFREDRHADCKLLVDKQGSLRFCDPAHGLYLDWIGCVQYARDCGFSAALQWVATAFGLEPGKEPSPEVLALRQLNSARPPAVPSVIQVKVRPWNKPDLGYWGAGNIGERQLLEGRVWPISDYWLNGTHRRAPAMAYAYKEDDGYKLYFPQQPKRYRFLSTTRVLSCYELLPQSGPLVVITSSKKDCLCLRSFGYAAVAPQGEGMNLPAHLLWELRQRFTRVLLFYDNDYPGLQLAHAKCAAWQLDDYVFLPLEQEAKDPFEYVCRYGPAAARTLFARLLNSPLTAA